MSKANQAHQFYSYTSPASDIQYTPSAPSAEDVNQPPSYDDAIRLRPGMLPETSNRKPFDGYVQDTSTTIPPFNPSSTAGAATFSSSSPSTNPYLQPNIPEFDEDFITAIPEEQQRLLSDDNDDQAFRGRPPPPGYAPYLAPYKTLKDGSIISRDEHLNRDGEALVQFLKQHNTPPNMAVRFRGWHEETFWRSRTSRDNDGNVIELQEPETRTITDFEFEIDCSDCISPFCQGIYVLPDKKTGEIKTVRQLCDDYVHEKNKLKELRLTKEIEWNYAELTRAFTAAIRAYGYHHAVEITFETKENKITVKTQSRLSRLADNWIMKAFCYLTCLIILAWPIMFIYRKRFGHATLKSKWTMTVSERDWYQRHITEVLGKVRTQGQALGVVPFIL